MATFGSFEADREIYSGPDYAVYSAKKSGDAGTAYAIKLFFLPPVGMATESEGSTAPLSEDIRRRYLERICLQQQAAENSKFVAPILESSHDERGVWYATRFYWRSINKIISGRVALNREALQHIIRGAAQGALDLKRNCGRSHGEILPSNVQISRSERIDEAEVVLSDPLPGDRTHAAQYELADLRAIGKILLQMVLRRLFAHEEDVPILPILSSPEWQQSFGNDADRWVDLCNRLLVPNLSLDQYSLEKLVADLEQVKPRSRAPMKLLLAATVALVLGAAATFFYLGRTQEQTVEITSDPPGATIVVATKEVGTTPFRLNLAEGTHFLEAHHQSLPLLGLSTNWVMKPGISSKLHFQFPHGSVAIKSVPPGATVTRDGVNLGSTPADGTPLVIPVVAPGQVGYLLNLDAYQSASLTGAVVADQRLLLQAILERVGGDETPVEFDSIPSGAKIFEQGKFLTETPGIKSMKPGAHVLTAVYRDWPAREVSLSVQKGTGAVANIYLPHGRLVFESVPSGATVWLGTNLIGTTPTGDLLRPAGTNVFRFEFAGFETTNVTVVLEDSPSAAVRVKPVLKTTNGVIEFSADPAEATIYDAAGKVLGRPSPTPLQITVPPGLHAFTAKIEGLANATASLQIEKGELKRYAFAFDYGTVRVESVPTGAIVSAGGRELGATPKTFVQPSGAIVLYQIASPGFLSATNGVVVGRRETKSNLVSLIPEPIRVVFSSDPDGAQYFSGGRSLADSSGVYLVLAGSNTIVAKHLRYHWLEDVTNVVVVKKGADNNYQFKFNYGRLEFADTPPGVAIYERGSLVARTPTNLYVRPGRVEYDFVLGGLTNRIGTNVSQGALHRLRPVFEVKSRYTNSAGMVLVRVQDGFYVGMFEVTQEQYQRVMGGAAKKPLQPMVNVSWSDAAMFCQKLSRMDAAFLAEAGIGGWNYSLPKEPDWVRFVEANPNQIKEAVFSGNQGSRGTGFSALPDSSRVPGAGVISPLDGAAPPIASRPFAAPKEIDFRRNSFNQAGIFDLFGNVAEWMVGSNDQPSTSGGSFKDRPPSPESMMTSIDRKPSAIFIEKGAPNIGIRCVLKPTLQ